MKSSSTANDATDEGFVAEKPPATEQITGQKRTIFQLSSLYGDLNNVSAVTDGYKLFKTDVLGPADMKMIREDEDFGIVRYWNK